MDRTASAFIEIVKERLGYELTDMQKRVLYANGHYALGCNRQDGKTTVLLLKGILNFIQNQDSRILFVSPNQAMLECAKQELHRLVTELRCIYPAIYFALPYVLRGSSFDLILVDEKDLWRDSHDFDPELQLRPDGQIMSLYTREGFITRQVVIDSVLQKLIERGYMK